MFVYLNNMIFHAVEGVSRIQYFNFLFVMNMGTFHETFNYSFKGYPPPLFYFLFFIHELWP